MSNKTGIYCPYCGCKFSKHYNRKDLVIYVCSGTKYPYCKEGHYKEPKIASKQYRFHNPYGDFKLEINILKILTLI